MGAMAGGSGANPTGIRQRYKPGSLPSRPDPQRLPTIRRLGARYPIRPSGFLSNDGQLCGPGMSEASGPRRGAAVGAGTGRRNQEIARSVGLLRESSIRLSGTAPEPVVVAGGALVEIAPELGIVHPVSLAGLPGQTDREPDYCGYVPAVRVRAWRGT
jgi:hypothetical protein